MPHGGAWQGGHCRGLEEGGTWIRGVTYCYTLCGQSFANMRGSRHSRKNHGLGVCVTCKGHVLWQNLGFHPSTALPAHLGLSTPLLHGEHEAPSQAWGWDRPGRSSHQGLAPSCRFLRGPSWAWGLGSRAYICKRISCRPCPPCLVSASLSSSTSVAIPSTVTASCSHFTGKHPQLNAPAGDPAAALSQALVPSEHLWRARILPGPATLPGGARHPRGLGGLL